MQGRRDSSLDAVGNTPVVRRRKLVSPESADVLVKLEFGNPAGSYKDRIGGGFLPPLLNADVYDEVRAIEESTGDLFQ